MTDLYPADDPDGRDDLAVLRRAADAHAAACDDVAAFLRRVPVLPEPSDIAEYGNLLAREEDLRAVRQDAAEAAGLFLPSVDSR
ncbi:hypothetical protein [Plantactinospora sp. KBS50]|uniref:hypothetical protein n=1 Tax=Plantactinospora sp. KBS50 TaxID=2024580 RepID=UPI000BAAB060|nr:hypothetical protein [Plantactinospora sp. KBS50]ASW55031.1 hypothetical protein CIK06_13835 [Plantactinospora sp. KBS50]